MGGEMIDVQGNADISVMRDPNVVLAEARKAAQALMDVVSQKKRPVIINKEQYLEFEDWQTLAKFYGLAAKITKTEFVDFGGAQGYQASADVIRLSDGMVVSSGEAMCLNDEEKWSGRAKYEFVDGEKKQVGTVPVPLFQLRSMAQTRACAKALRNVLAWVVVLAGYRATPAEEMTGNEAPANGKPVVQPPQEKSDTPAPSPDGHASQHGDIISEPQSKRLYAIRKGAKYPDEKFKEWLWEKYGITDDRKIEKSDYDAICKHVQEYKANG